jgi:3-phosphoshikimate 1-carboxyvinyltransferase
MLTNPYSAPDFDVYGDAEPEHDDAAWPAPVAGGPVDASVSLPGSKSLTNRELVLAALADGPSLLRAPLHSMDSTNMVEALRALGTTIVERPATGAFGADWLVTPGELFGSTTVECGLAGTVMRFVPPLAALALGPTVFDADPSARNRPMSTMITSLQALGVDISDDGRKALPFTVHGTGAIAGGKLTIDASSSSQFVSGLLLAAPRFEQGLHLVHEGERLPSLPHIEMTIAALAARGVTVEQPDLSNAAPFLAAALVTGGSVTLRGWPASTTQVGADLAELLPRFGATVTLEGDRLTVTGGERITAVDLDLTTGGELAPALTALAALADGPSTITGIGHIRHHETDRLAALATEINKLGGAVTELPDGLRIDPRPLHGGEWSSYHDHRMATTGAILGLVVPGITIENIATTAKTLPQFTELWHAMLGA